MEGAKGDIRQLPSGASAPRFEIGWTFLGGAAGAGEVAANGEGWREGGQDQYVILGERERERGNRESSTSGAATFLLGLLLLLRSLVIPLALLVPLSVPCPLDLPRRSLSSPRLSLLSRSAWSLVVVLLLLPLPSPSLGLAPSGHRLADPGSIRLFARPLDAGRICPNPYRGPLSRWSLSRPSAANHALAPRRPAPCLWGAPFSRWRCFSGVSRSRLPASAIGVSPEDIC